MDRLARHRWIATHILPLEAHARRWLHQHVRSLSPADADDLIQEMYARIWNTDFTTIQNPATYLYVALRNLLLSHMRDSKIIPLERMGEIEYLRVPIDELGPERRVAARQELEHLSHAIESLPSQCRRVFELRKLQDLSQKEVARELGISERTVEKHLAKALSRITKASVRERGTDAHPNRSGVETDGTRTERD